ncbi:MAG: radical SAM protein [Deltaproteobacteria bacterium]|nr:radical SAM protein [Deltaproteobacteria bacterium]
MRAPADIFRLESFGGFYYSRRTRETVAFPAAYADFLLETTRRPADRILRDDRDRFAQIRRRRKRTLEQWQRDGILDAELRCRARVVANRPPSGVLGAPLATSFEITERCNLRCQHCYVERGAARRPEVSPAVLGRAFAELDRAGSPAVTLSGGEPLMRRDVWEILDRARDHQLEIKFCTNATLVDRVAARRLVCYPIHTFSISLEGASAAVHDRGRGSGNFERVARGVALLRDAGAARIMLRITVTSHNLATLPEIAAVGDGWGVDAISFRPYRYNGAALDSTLVVERAAYDRAMRRLKRGWRARCKGVFGRSLPTRSPSFARYVPRFGCIGGNGTLSVKADGSGVACATVRSSGEWNLEQHSLIDCWYRDPAINRWRQMQAPAVCRDCDRLAECGGGCRARAYAMGQGIAGPDPWCCSR